MNAVVEDAILQHTLMKNDFFWLFHVSNASLLRVASDIGLLAVDCNLAKGLPQCLFMKPGVRKPKQLA